MTDGEKRTAKLAPVFGLIGRAVFDSRHTLLQAGGLGLVTVGFGQVYGTGAELIAGGVSAVLLGLAVELGRRPSE